MSAIYPLKGKYKIQSLIFFFVGLLAVSHLWMTHPSEAVEEKQPFSADHFVDSIGLNTRLSYADWPTASNWANPEPQQDIETLIADLGIRHLRDRMPHPSLQPSIKYANPRLAKLYSQYGMKFTVRMDIRDKENDVLIPSQIPAFINWYANGKIRLDSGKKVLVRDMLDAIEGPNEYDKHNHPDKRDTNWVQNLTSFQERTFREAKNNEFLASIPVIAPSLVQTAYCGSSLDSFATNSDLGNLHPYPNYPYMRHPVATLSWHLSHAFNCTKQLPIWATETGYLTHHNNPSEISERTAAKYIPRLLTEYFLTGKIQRTFIHEIASNGVNAWGLVAASRTREEAARSEPFQLRPKPAYYAVKSLIRLLNEAEWTKDRQTWVFPNTNLKPIRFSLKDKKDSTHHLLLQKNNGHYFLLLWQEVESYNPNKGNFEVQPDQVTLNLANNVTPVSIYQYDDQFRYNKRTLNRSTRTIRLNVPDTIMVVELVS
ncbi:MAG: hypothetical protein F6K11_33800 [Leptolyngbya sp. SIO3F4]|nr:hypothetical protein [Leptolyngbya sp. SIO3F4]